MALRRQRLHTLVQTLAKQDKVVGVATFVHAPFGADDMAARFGPVHQDTGEALQAVVVVGRHGHRGVHRDLAKAGWGVRRGLFVPGPEVAWVGWRLCVLFGIGVAVTPQFAVPLRQ